MAFLGKVGTTSVGGAPTATNAELVGDPPDKCGPDSTALRWSNRAVHRFNDNLIHWQSNEELLRALMANSVDLVLIGGLAVAWYCERRQADDMDLLVAPTLDNSNLIYKALLSLNLSGFQSDSFAKSAVRARIRQRYNAEVLTPSLGGPEYAEVARSCEPAKLLGISIRVPSRAMLVRLKLHSITAKHDGREKHLADVELLLNDR
jgi:hypothetical protein